MPKNLVIVESPAKAKTIEKFLGKDFTVASSYGHIVDLPVKEMGIDIENGFKPEYRVSPDKKEVIKKLKKLASGAETIWLASDEDREGEAIAWHLFNQLKLTEDKTKRIVFHEITENAILRSIEQPREIDQNLVNAQQARRVLDRLVGYELSPVLWKKIKGGLSAGRVQSVAVKLIVEREKEIEDFKSVSYYKAEAEFENKQGEAFKAKLEENFSAEKDAWAFLESCKDAEFTVKSVESKPVKRGPSPPFTTSALQQEASRKLGFPVAKTMRIAQRLYESGYITYMRTDSVNLSEEALNKLGEYIVKTMGKEYSRRRKFKTKTKGAQEAHEAIRPTDPSRENLPQDADMNKLYSLIHKRAVASQMSEAVLEKTRVEIENNRNDKLFITEGEVVKFDGFLKMYRDYKENGEEQKGLLPALKKTEKVISRQIQAREKFTTPPPRYTEASLVRKLEELGIGRPSTYAPTISTIQKRGYVEKSKQKSVKQDVRVLYLIQGNITRKITKENRGGSSGKLVPTDIGRVVNDFLDTYFKNIMDYGFTAEVENRFDRIAEGKEKWIPVIEEFYSDFHATVEEVVKTSVKAKGERLLGTDPVSGKKVFSKIGRFGPMIQIGESTDEEKPKFAGLPKNMNIRDITLEQALELFRLPKVIGAYEDKDVLVSNGKYGPYIKWNNGFISLPKGADPTSFTLEEAVALIEQKKKAQMPVGEYENLPVYKGKGRFGPFLKWNDMYINVSKQYDFENLSAKDISEIIAAKLQKDKEKIVMQWDEKNIRLEKARWGQHVLIQGKKKVRLPKTFDIQSLTLEKAEELLSGKKK